MAILKWLHLSDLHFSCASIDANDVREALKRQHLKEKYDLIFLTGDFAYQAIFGESVEKFISEMIVMVGCKKENVFFVPGNHDYERSEPRTSALKTIANVQEISKSVRQAMAIGSDEYREFCERVLGEGYGKTCLEPCIVKTLDYAPVDIILLNTCLTSYDDNDRNHLYICSKQLQEAFHELDISRMQIVIGHHGANWLVDNDHSTFIDWLIRYTSTKLYLCGHSHKLGIIKDGSAYQIVSGTLMEDHKADFGFVKGTINTESYVIEGTCYKYLDEWQIAKESDGTELRFRIPTRQQNDKNITAGQRRRCDDDYTQPEYSLKGVMQPHLDIDVIRRILQETIHPKSEITIFSMMPINESLWKNIGGLDNSELAIRLADKIYTVMSQDARFPFLASLRQMLLSNYINLDVVHKWWSLLSNLTGDNCETDFYELNISLYDAFIRPIEERIEKVRVALNPYLVHPLFLTEPNILGYLAGVSEQIRREASGCLLRGNEFNMVHSQWKKGSGNYILIEASEGFGKTLFCYSLLHMQANEQSAISSGSKAAACANWLPNAICVFGKTAKTEDKAFDLLMAQINASLAYFIPYTKHDNYANILTIGLKRLVEEVGPVLLIIDAIDEFVHDVEGLEFLPHALPEGVTVLLTMRKERALRERLEEKLSHTIPLALPTFTKKEIATILQPEKPNSNNSFVNKVFKATNGIPILVRAVADELIKSGKIDLVDIDSSTAAYFIRMRKIWNSSPISKAVLMLLVFSEPVSGFVNIDILLNWVRIRIKRNDISSDEVRDSLVNVLDQLDNPETGIFTLRYRGMAESMTGPQGYSCVEWEEGMESILEMWKNSHIDDSMAILLLILGNRPRNSKANWENMGFRFVEFAKTLSSKQALLLFSIFYNSDIESADRLGVRLSARKEKRSIQPQFIYDAIDAACAQGVEGATKQLYYLYYILGNTIDNKKHALDTLSELVEQKSPQAMYILGLHYFMNPEEDGIYGKKLLQEAISLGVNEARLALAEELYSGERIPKDIKEAEAILDVPQKNREMKTLLGYLYVFEWIDGSMLECGQSLLLQAFEEGDLQAGYIYAKSLLKSKDEEDVAKGCKIVQELSEKRHPQAMSILGCWYIDREYGFNDTKRGKKLLKQGADSEETFCCVQYANYLLKHEASESSYKEARRYLSKPIDKGDELAMLILGEELLERSLKEKQEGIQLLEKAHQAGSQKAIALLGLAFLMGNGVRQDVSKGIDILRVEAQNGNHHAREKIGGLYLAGYCDLFSYDDIMLWLKLSDEEGDAAAPLLIYYILDKKSSESPSPEYLVRAKERGNKQDDVLHTYLALTSGTNTADTQMLLESMQAAANEGVASANFYLYHIFSDMVPALHDKAKALFYLEKAAEQRDKYAMKVLADIYMQDRNKFREGIKLKADYVRECRKETIIDQAIGREEYHQGNFAEAAALFASMARLNNVNAANNFAYMLRRGEAKPIADLPNAMQLLEKAEKDAIDNSLRVLIKINIALCNFLGYACTRSTDSAREIFIELAKQPELLLDAAGWWMDLAKKDDAEGCLVILILYTLGILPTEYKSCLAHCLDIAKLFELPGWIVENVNAKSN